MENTTMRKTTLSLLRVFGVLLALLGTSLTFLSGVFSSETQLEKIAEYATDVVVNHTERKQLCALTVEKTNESGSIIDHETEFHALYGTFRQEKITFASVINPDKSHNIVLGDNFSSNLSMLYVGPVGSKEYKGHYKHYIYPIEIMFPDVKMYDVSKYIAYISKSHADSILSNNGITRQENGEYTSSDYKSLLKQLVPFNVDGEISYFAIQNIYYESNYYYKGLNDTVGDFVMVSYYLPNNLRSEQKNMYFMSEYPYQNKYFMNYINNAYPSKLFKLSLNRFNIVGDVDDSFLTSFYYSNMVNSDTISVLIATVAIIILLLSLLLNVCDKSKKKMSFLYCLVVAASLITPYMVFFIIFKVTSNIIIFSEVSTKICLFSILVYFLAFLIINWLKANMRNNNRKTIGVINCHEIDI